MLLRVKRLYWQLAFWCVWLVCTVLFVMPATELPAIDVWDKAEHAFAFALLMCLLLPAHAHQLSLAVMAATLASYGVLVEVVQYFVPGRSFSVLDMVADVSGVVIILLLNPWLRAERWSRT